MAPDLSMAPEFSRLQRVDGLPRGGRRCRVQANGDECAALVARLHIPAIAALACDWQLSPSPGGRVIAQGHLTARVTQVCVVSLEEFESEMTEDFTVHFVPEAAFDGDEDSETPDQIPYGGAQVDLGEATAEQLALALDPYPHKPGAELPDPDTTPPHPFDALRRLRS
jgi:uncharacterized metal-binding protein YceD (DUF177 family)